MAKQRTHTKDNSSLKKTVFLGGLPHTFDKTAIYDVFKQFGPIKTINIPLNKTTQKMKGFCFLCFKNTGGWKRAIDAREVHLGGKIISIRPALSTKEAESTKMSANERRIYSRGVPSQMTEVQLRKLFGRFGDIEEVRLVTNSETSKPTGAAYITMVTALGFERAILNSSLLFLEHGIKAIKSDPQILPQQKDKKENRGGRLDSTVDSTVWEGTSQSKNTEISPSKAKKFSNFKSLQHHPFATPGNPRKTLECDRVMLYSSPPPLYQKQKLANSSKGKERHKTPRSSFGYCQPPINAIEPPISRSQTSYKQRDAATPLDLDLDLDLEQRRQPTLFLKKKESSSIIDCDITLPLRTPWGSIVLIGQGRENGMLAYKRGDKYRFNLENQKQVDLRVKRQQQQQQQQQN